MIARSLTWADLDVGQRFDTRTRTITESDVTAFAGLTGDYSEIHVSRSYAAGTEFGEPIAHGLLVLSYAHGLMLGGGLLAGTAIAFLGLSDWRFIAPVRLGDTIRVRFDVAEMRVRSSRPDQGVLTFDTKVLNQRDEVVQAGKKALLLTTKEN
jgi:acyl dehydratase